MSDYQAAPLDDNRATQGRLVAATGSMPALRDPYGEVGAYYHSSGDADPTSGPDLREYWRILMKRKWIVISIVVASIALGAVYTLMKTPLYTSTVRLQIDRNVAKIVEGGSISPVESNDLEFLKTQYELLQSRTMAERVAVA
ncbi:MAG TPA: Wzz/FepE/Etk N-terminal domain-containing protein, partial [Hyphomicrobium sp.]